MEFPHKTRMRYASTAKYFLISSAPVGPTAPPIHYSILPTQSNKIKTNIIFIMNCESTSTTTKTTKKALSKIMISNFVFGT